ncbi:AAA family ATPase [Kitasatospora sp. SUK 42]|uniref:AAA family ATPase n=1 Tax=Kitasatospora sp. SUK 42 TaxID=1588882 RepID=UPI0018CB32C6|nr:AAA family ATPase [Kitasatospora sp. SUK 42]MBV2153487.1 AAA family ATPase [Kitasatospora sp. SUK 42]
MLIVLSGLPATGKTTLARSLAHRTGAVHLRVDTIEQAVLRSGVLAPPLGPVGYAVAYALAEEHLRQGLTVIAESVNPLAVTRTAWREVAVRAGARCLEAETVCSDPVEHRRRAEHRTVDVPGLELPDWTAITTREYEPWDREHLVLDTAGRPVEDCAAELYAAVTRAV